MEFHGGSFLLGLIVMAVIGGLWMIGTGLIHAARMKRRLTVVRNDEPAD